MKDEELAVWSAEPGDGGGKDGRRERTGCDSYDPGWVLKRSGGSQTLGREGSSSQLHT